MSHFAKVNQGKVLKVIVAEPEFLENFIDTDPGEWIQTSYNTRGGVHLKGGTPLRMNFAGVGYTYDNIRDAFIPPQPFSSWTLNDETCLWEPPVPRPETGGVWNEETLSWDALESE